MTNITTTLAEFVSDTGYDDVPPAAIKASKRLVLDSLGCAFGALETESGRIGLDYVASIGGTPVATVIGTGARSAATNAAYANARLGGVLDADDTFPSICHFGNATTCSALALAEHYARSGRDFLTAVAVGFDVGARIGSAIGLPVLIENGKVMGYPESGGPSATMTWASVGASCSVARLGVQRTTHAFGIAGANAPLPSLHGWAGQTELPMFKMADAGWCAHTGISATLLAAAGSTGYSNILDSAFGFWRFFGAQKLDADFLLSGLGSQWHIQDTTYKPWPSCRWLHYPVTAFLALKNRHSLLSSEMEKVVIRSNPFAMSSRFLAQQPANGIAAQFSHAHSIAMAAFEVTPGPLWYSTENISGPQVTDFRNRVSVVRESMDEDLSDWVKHGQYRRLPAGVDIHARGTIFSATVDMALGDPWSEETVFTDEMLHSKFTNMMLGNDPARVDLAKQAARIIAAVEKLDEINDIREFTELLRRPTVA